MMTGVVIWGLYFVVPLVLVPLLGPRFASTVPVLHMITGLAIVQAGEIVLVRLLLATDPADIPPPGSSQLARF